MPDYSEIPKRTTRFVQPTQNPHNGLKIDDRVTYQGKTYKVVSTQALNSSDGMALMDDDKVVLKVFGKENLLQIQKI